MTLRVAVAVGLLCAAVGLLLTQTRAAELGVSPGGRALRAEASVAFLEPAVDHTWIYTGNVSVAVAVRGFDVPEDGRVCVAASWAVAEDGSGDWSCYNAVDEHNVLHADVTGAADRTVPSGQRYRIVAQLVGLDGVPISSAATRTVFKPRTPRLVKPGEERDMNGADDSWTRLPDADLALLASAAPTQFWHYYSTKKFVRIISPRNASAVQAKQEGGGAKIVLVLRYTQPMLGQDTNPEVCVTVDRAMHTCSPATTQVTLPSMPVGRHRFTAQVRSGDGVYYGRPHSVEVVVLDSDDPRPAREVLASEASPMSDVVAMRDDVLTKAECNRLVSTSSRLSWKHADSIDGEPSPLDKARVRVLDKYRVLRLTADVLQQGRLGADYNDALRVVTKLKKMALRLVGLGSCDPADCLEDAVEVLAFDKDQYHYPHAEHVADECVRRMLRRPITHGVSAHSSFDACAEEAATRDPRLFTVLFFLNSLAPGGGGATVLPMLDAGSHPVRGRAMWWKECRPTAVDAPAAQVLAAGELDTRSHVVNGTVCLPLQRTMHGSMPVVLAGAHKYVAKVHVLFNEHSVGH